jgi:hypothetical protein
LKYINKINSNITPSNIASYNCDGCLGLLSMRGYIIAKGKSVTLPYSSVLMKLEILPRNKPIGATKDTKSDK